MQKSVKKKRRPKMKKKRLKTERQRILDRKMESMVGDASPESLELVTMYEAQAKVVYGKTIEDRVKYHDVFNEIMARRNKALDDHHAEIDAEDYELFAEDELAMSDVIPIDEMENFFKWIGY
jgi:hypothetical protein